MSSEVYLIQLANETNQSLLPGAKRATANGPTNCDNLQGTRATGSKQHGQQMRPPAGFAAEFLLSWQEATYGLILGRREPFGQLSCDQCNNLGGGEVAYGAILPRKRCSSYVETLKQQAGMEFHCKYPQ